MDGMHAALYSLQCSNLKRNKYFNGKQLQMYIRMGIVIFKMFIWGGISLGYIFSCIPDKDI